MEHVSPLEKKFFHLREYFCPLWTILVQLAGVANSQETIMRLVSDDVMASNSPEGKTGSRRGGKIE
jgi:hypothetical protein